MKQPVQVTEVNICKELIKVKPIAYYSNPDMNKTMDQLTMDDIKSYLEGVFEVAEIRERTRKRKVVLARQLAMTISRTKLRINLSDIGDYFGGYDHATVLHAIKEIRHQYEIKSNILEHRKIKESLNFFGVTHDDLIKIYPKPN